MLVPVIHSDSKINLQEEVCTRKKKQQSQVMFGISFFCVCVRVQSLFFVISCLLLALRRGSSTPPNTMTPSAGDADKWGNVGIRESWDPMNLLMLSKMWSFNRRQAEWSTVVYMFSVALTKEKVEEWHVSTQAFKVRDAPIREI